MAGPRKTFEDLELSKSSSEMSILEDPESTLVPLSHSTQFRSNNPQITVAGHSSEMIPNLFFNPLFHHSNMVNPISFNYLNQGIFIPRSENNQFSFIPGNIGYDVKDLDNRKFQAIIPEFQYENQRETTDDSDKLNIFDNPPKQIYFVPTPETKSKSIQDELKDNNYETYLVPIKIKKETNGNIELLPESDAEVVSQQLNPDQLNILKKIYLLKNQKSKNDKPDKPTDFTKMVKIDDQFIDKCEETSVDGGKNVINNIQDKTEGFMMVRFNKPMTNNIHRGSSDLDSLNIASNPLKLSIANSSIIRDKKSKSVRIKKKDKNAHILTLSAQTNKHISISNPPSRFRRLRLDDKKTCWHANTVSCLDTKMKEIPANILDLSESNSISISYTIYSLFNQQKISHDVSDMVVTCEHGQLQERKSKGNIKEILPDANKRYYWSHMCSMNNCEFSKSQKSIF